MNRPSYANRILSGLPPAELARLEPLLEPAAAQLGEVLYQPGERIRHVYFPATGVVSIVVKMANGAGAEAGMVGNEGMLGLWALFGVGTCPFEAVVQEPLNGHRAEADAFAAAVERGPSLRGLLRGYTDAFLTMASQSAACNRLHTAEQRLCRWLLMSRDRVAADEFTVTQEFLGRMLGVRRMSITAPARKLQAAGLIRYARGRMRILDRAGLEAASCECYRVVRDRLDALLPPGR